MQQRDDRTSEVAKRLDSAIERVDGELRAASERIEAAAQALRARYRPALDRLAADRDSLQSTLARMSAVGEEAASAIRRHLTIAARDLEAEAAVAAADVEAELADTLDQYREAATALLAAWRRRLDQLAEQAETITRDGREQLQSLLDRAEYAYRTARRQLDEARLSAGGSLDAVRGPIRDALGALRVTVSSLLARLTTDDDENGSPTPDAPGAPDA